MGIVRNIFGVLYCFIVIVTHVKGQSLVLSDNADSAYLEVVRSQNARLPNSLDTMRADNPNYPEVKKAKIVAKEKAWMEHRIKGIEFWQRFPEDERRFEWLETTVNLSRQSINYWRYPDIAVESYLRRENFLSSYEAEINYEALWKWERLYQGFRNEYFQYVKQKGMQSRQANFLAMELASFFNLSRNIVFRVSPFLSTTTIKNEILDKMKVVFEKSKDEANVFMKELNYPLLSGYRFLGLNQDSLLNLMNDLKEDRNIKESIIKWIEQSTNLINLTRSKMDLKFTTPSGEKFDLQKWRSPGSVVLVDIWSLSCTSCIGRMSYLKELHDKYRDRGFTILSLCLGDGKDERRVDSIKLGINASWKSLMMGKLKMNSNSFPSTFWEKYGFKFVPHMFLLDQTGKVVLYNHELVEGNIEPYLEPLLSKM